MGTAFVRSPPRPCMNTTTGQPLIGLTPPLGELPFGLNTSIGICRSAFFSGTRLKRVTSPLAPSIPGTVDAPAAFQDRVSGPVGSPALGGVRKYGICSV